MGEWESGSGRVGGQKIVGLPTNRLSIEPSFTYIRFGIYGPLLIKQDRKEMKRYAIIFTCMSSRAVHREVVYTMETDSFIQSQRRFIGNKCLIRCDNGTNFAGAQLELQQAFSEMDNEQISHSFQKFGADWITRRNNPSSGSHMSEV